MTNEGLGQIGRVLFSFLCMVFVMCNGSSCIEQKKTEVDPMTCPPVSLGTMATL